MRVKLICAISQQPGGGAEAGPPEFPLGLNRSRWTAGNVVSARVELALDARVRVADPERGKAMHFPRGPYLVYRSCLALEVISGVIS